MYGCPIWCCFCKSWTTFFGNLSFDDMWWIITYISKDKDLFTKNKEIIFSFMWSWEPLINYDNVAKCINNIMKTFNNVSISIATSWVQINNLSLLTSQITYFPKIQLSLHSPFDDERKKLIPNTCNLKEIFDILSLYQSKYKAKVILNYIVLNRTNDSFKHVNWLKKILDEYQFSLKINQYHDVETWYIQSKKIWKFIEQLNKQGIFPKIYETDWVDIWAACWQLFSKKI
jgi:adenine C2-methylase RlmN of 23S rRNA A2503 and tRNA A37